MAWLLLLLLLLVDGSSKDMVYLFLLFDLLYYADREEKGRLCRYLTCRFVRNKDVESTVSFLARNVRAISVWDYDCRIKLYNKHDRLKILLNNGE